MIYKYYERFMKISGKKKQINKEEFIKSLGLMGIEEGRFISEKIFSLMESEQRGTADLEGFIQYMLIY